MPDTYDGMFAAIERNLEARTGKTLKDWVALLKKSGAKDHREAVRWFKEAHGIGKNTAYTIIARTSLVPDWMTKSGDTLLDQQYFGREKLRPIYEKVAKIVKGLGTDVAIGERKTYVAFARGAQFAVLHPSTKTRADLGLRLPGVQAKGRLKTAGTTAGGSMTHKVALQSTRDIDAEVITWLKRAYAARGNR